MPINPGDGRCSLAVAQDRRSLPEQIAAEGIPTPLIIHLKSVEPSSSRNISNGQRVDFEASTRDADPYLRLDTQAASITGPRAEASRFILYKADIPDMRQPFGKKTPK